MSAFSEKRLLSGFEIDANYHSKAYERCAEAICGEASRGIQDMVGEHEHSRTREMDLQCAAKHDLQPHRIISIV